MTDRAPAPPPVAPVPWAQLYMAEGHHNASRLVWHGRVARRWEEPQGGSDDNDHSSWM